jgi:hypothetical protein
VPHGLCQVQACMHPGMCSSSAHIHPQHPPPPPPAAPSPVHVILVIFNCHNVGCRPAQCWAVALAALCGTAADAPPCTAAAAAAWLEAQALHLLLRHRMLRPAV